MRLAAYLKTRLTTAAHHGGWTCTCVTVPWPPSPRTLSPPAMRLLAARSVMTNDTMNAFLVFTWDEWRGAETWCLPERVMSISSLRQSPLLLMKIALPLTAAEEFSSHYGASAKFIVFDVDRAQRTVQRRLVIVPQASGPCEWPRYLRAAGVDLVLAGGMGRGARQHMAEHGVQVLTGVPAATPDALVAAWLEGKLVAGENACDGTGPHHHDHHHGSGDHHAHGGCGCSH